MIELIILCVVVGLIGQMASAIAEALAAMKSASGVRGMPSARRCG